MIDERKTASVEDRLPDRLWRREGLLLAPPRNHDWWCSHAQSPTVLALSDRLWRVYFGARDTTPCSHILCADLDPGDSFRVLRIHPDPVLTLGATGAFDSQGTGPSTALLVDGRVHLYYTGIIRRSDIPYQTAIGLAVSDDGLAFDRVTAGPILSAGPHDPLFMSTPYVRMTAAGFEMWYASGIEWRSVNGNLEPFYVLRYTRSEDGVVWSLDTELVRGFRDDSEAGLTRPWIFIRGNERHLWFSRRGSDRFRHSGAAAYRLWHAIWDSNGRLGNCDETVRFENPPGHGDWDEWMQAYPCVVPLGDDLIMLYNGNDFGRGGFGYARLVGGAQS